MEAPIVREETIPYRDQHPDRSGAGLEVAVHQQDGTPSNTHLQDPGIEAVTPEPALAKYSGSPAPEKGAFVGQTVFEPNDPPAYTSLPGTPRASPWKRKPLLFAGLGVAAILIIVGAVVGGVFGSRAAKATSTAPPPATTGRVASTHGVWNGTGIGVLSQDRSKTNDSYDLILFYQDYTGDVKYMPIVIDEGDHSISAYESARSLGVKATPGTGFGTLIYWSTVETDNNQYYMITYVAENGTICNVETSSLQALGPWTPGNLSAYNFQAPKNVRSAMRWSSWDECFGSMKDSAGARLFAGGIDGKMHEYSFDSKWNFWDPKDRVIEGTYAAGGIDLLVDSYCGLLIYFGNADGRISYTVSEVNSDAYWTDQNLPYTSPANGSHVGVGYPDTGIATYVFTNANTSTYVYYLGNDTGTPDPTIESAINDNTDKIYLNPWISQKTSIDNAKMMPGSDMAPVIPVTNITTYTILFYQDSGSSISWR